jgi:ribosomal RNA-processing protein 8
MDLFQVPGWDVPSSAWVDATPAKKRKHVSDSTDDRLQAAHINLDKLVEKLGDAPPPPKKSKRKRDSDPSEMHKKNSTSKPVSGASHSKPDDSQKSKSVRNKKKNNSNNQDQTKAATPRLAENAPEKSPKKPGAQKKKHGKKSSDDKTNDQTKASPAAAGPTTSGASILATEKSQTLTPLQKTMKNNLEGARFRWINEVLYKSDSAEAHQMMRQDPTVFAEVYHLLLSTFPIHTTSQKC